MDVIVTTAGGIEEDLIKCLAPTYRGDFSLPGGWSTTAVKRTEPDRKSVGAQ